MKLPVIRRDTLAQKGLQSARELIIERVRIAQVVGLGGGRFPTAKKLARSENATALIVNGLQSEPDNASDLALLEDRTTDVLAGAALAALACNTPHIALALPAGLSNALTQASQSALQAELDWLNSVRAIPVKARQVHLPAGHASGQEHQLAHRLGLLAEPKNLEPNVPLVDLGLLCLNLATCYAIGRAVYRGEVLHQRLVSINGTTRWIDFGTPVRDLVNPAWINGRDGGYPDSGNLVDAGIFCVTSPPEPPAAPCINCGACAPACPVNLAPDELHKAIDLGCSPAPHLKLRDCIECGACNAVCPSGLWLTQEFRGARERASEAATRAAAAAKAKARVQARIARLKAEEVSRAERQRDRAERGQRTW